MFNRVLGSQNHKLQTEEEAIQTLSNRLQHATLSADRKSAVLGLKSFSRQFRESVVQHGLRALLLTIGKDSDNAMLVKAVLETLIILFLRTQASEDQARGFISNHSRVQNGKYPSPLLGDIEIDQFSMWIADEVLLSDANLKVVMEAVQEHEDFHIRLYALQFMEALVATRPIRTKECLINIPLAVPTIVSLLNDANDPIRNEAILLLMAIVNKNYNIQKLVAFENTFDRLFEIIEEEGGIRGSILVQDCLTLLTNLLMYNASNQKLFLETDCVPKLAKLLAEPVDESFVEGILDEEGKPIPSPPIVWTEQRLQNISIALEICKAFIDPDNQLLSQKQEKLYDAGIFFSVLRLIFSPLMENPIRKTALRVAGDIIGNNPKLQLQFSQIDVPYLDPSLPPQVQNYDKPIPAPLALLNWAILTNSVHVFDIRLASMYCLKCFFLGNQESKVAFITDQIKSKKNPNYYDELEAAQLEAAAAAAAADSDSAKMEPVNGDSQEAARVDNTLKKTPFANIFTTLMDIDFEIKLSPYRVWFSAVTLLYLFEDCPDTKQLAADLKVGNSEDGEEVMTCIQAISEILITNLENSDPRIAIGYLLLLTTWLFEDFDAVNDFLGDPSSIKSILAFLSKNSEGTSEIVHGMCSILIGVVYEFSSKKSPIPRAVLHELITKVLGVDNFALQVKQFKENSVFKHYDQDLDSEIEKDSTGLPKVYFTPEYIELVKDNLYRIRKSLSRDPEFEPRGRISFEVFEELENKNVELRKNLEQLKEDTTLTEAKLREKISERDENVEEMEKLLTKSDAELVELRQSEEVLTQKIEVLSKEVETLDADRKKFLTKSENYRDELQKLTKLNANNEASLNQLKQKLSDSESARQKAEDGINKMSRELFQLTKQQKEYDQKIATFEKEKNKLKSDHEKESVEYKTRAESARKTIDELRAKIAILERQSLDSPSGTSRDVSRLREFQNRVTELEESNENLMEKLKSAATVVMDLKNERAEYKDKVESLNLELSKAYEDLETFGSLMEEIDEIRAQNGQVKKTITDLTTSSDISSLVTLKQGIADLEAAQNSKLEQLEEELEGLKTKLLTERESFEEERKLLTEKLQESEAINESLNKKVHEILIGKSSNVEATELATTKDATRIGTGSNELEELEQRHSEGIREKEELYEKLQLQLSSTTQKLDDLISKMEILQRTTDEEKQDLLRQLKEQKELYAQLTTSGDANDESQVLDSAKNGDAEQLEVHSNGAKPGYEEADHSEYLELDALVEARKRIKDLENNIETLSENASSSLRTFKDAEARMKTEIEALTVAKTSLEDELAELKESYKRELEETTEKLEDLESVNLDLELQLCNLEKSRDEINSKYRVYHKEASVKISQLEDELSNLSDNLKNVERDRDAITGEFSELERRSNVISSELQAKVTTLQAIHNKGVSLAAKDKVVVEIKEKLATTMADLGTAYQRNKALAREKLTLMDQCEQTKDLLDGAELKIKEHEARIEGISKELENTRSEFELVKSRHLSNNHELTESLKQKEQKIAELESLKDEENKNSENNYKALIEENELTVQELRHKISDMEASMSSLEAEHKSKLEFQESEINHATESIRKELQTAKEANETLQSQLDEYAKSLDLNKSSEDARIVSLENEVESKDREISELQAAADASQADLTHANVAANEAADKLSHLKTIIEELEGKSEKLTTTLSEAESALLDVRSERDSLNDKLAAQLEETQLKEKNIDETIKKLRDDLDDGASENARLSKQIEEKNQELALKVDEIKEKSQEILEITNGAQLGSDNEESMNGLRSLSEEFRSQLSMHQDTLAQLRATVDAYGPIEDENNKRIANQEEVILDYLDQLKQLEAESGTLRTRISESEALREASEGELKELRSTMDDFKQSKEEDDAKFQELASSLKEQISVKDHEISELQAAVANAEEKLKQNRISDTAEESTEIGESSSVNESDEKANDRGHEPAEDSSSLDLQILELKDINLKSQQIIEDQKVKLSALIEELESFKAETERPVIPDVDKPRSDDSSRTTSKEMEDEFLQKINRLELEISDLKDEADIEGDLHHKAMEKTNKTLKELSTALEAANDQRSQLQQDFDSLKEHKSDEATLSQSKLLAELEDANSKLEERNRELELSEKERVALNEKLSKVGERSLETDVEAERAYEIMLKEKDDNGARLQADFDDLMLLWEEQEKKLLKYKKRLAAVGEEVTTDEESDLDLV